MPDKIPKIIRKKSLQCAIAEKNVIQCVIDDFDVESKARFIVEFYEHCSDNEEDHKSPAA